MLENIKAVIFDLDGTIVDSIHLWQKIYIDSLQKRNITTSANLADEADFISLNLAEAAKYFKRKFNLDETVEEIKVEWIKMAYYEYKTKIKLKRGVKRFLTLLQHRKVRIGLVTSNIKKLANVVLESHGIHDYFNAIITTDEAAKSKNSPAIYLYAAKKLGVMPEECIVFEDLLPAILGAKDANMKVIGVYDKHAEHQKELIIKHADEYILHFDEINEKLGVRAPGEAINNSV